MLWRPSNSPGLAGLDSSKRISQSLPKMDTSLTTWKSTVHLCEGLGREVRWQLLSPKLGIFTFPLTEFRVGEHRWIWDGRNEEGKPAASGVYIVRMDVGSFSSCVKVVMVK